MSTSEESWEWHAEQARECGLVTLVKERLVQGESQPDIAASLRQTHGQELIGWAIALCIRDNGGKPPAPAA